MRRRQRLVLVVWSSTFVVSILITAYQRNFLPVYQGRFDLLISDPVGGGARQGGGSDSSDSFRQLALNRTSTDLPTLFQVLRSQSLLESLASRHNLSAGALAARISVSTAGDSRNPADGVLKVALSGRNPQLDQKLLEELADAYLNYSLSQRQERLTAGLRFLDRQAPLLMSRANELSLQLARFRRTDNLLEPLVEGAAIRQLSGAAEQSIRSLQAERSRLLVARRGVVDGTLSARGFQEAIGTGSGGGASGGSGGGGLSIAGSSQGVLEQVGKLDDQIGEARSRYNPDSPMLQGLVERRRALLPLLRRNQLEAIDTALALNADRIEEARTQKAGIDQRFQQQPQLIREYDELQQKLNLALENLSGLRQAKENFSLELAQRTVPWRLIARPSVNPQPISPSVPRNLAMGLGLGLVAGVGAGLLRDRLDHVFHTPADAREDLQRPLLGHVPHVEFFQGVRENNRFLIEELDQKLKPLPDGTTGGMFPRRIRSSPVTSVSSIRKPSAIFSLRFAS